MIEQVALKFNGDVTFPMYLFHDAQPLNALATFTVSALANQQTIVPINKMISYAGETNKSGCYFFGYFQDDLGSVQAWNEIVTSINECNNFGLNPIEMQRLSTGVNVNNLSFTIKTHGFNLQMYAFRDHTQKIINNAWLFDNLIGLQMAADVIEMMQNNTRTNKDQRISQEMSQKLYNDLNTAKATEMHPFSVGLKERIEKEAKRVKKELYKKNQISAITSRYRYCKRVWSAADYSRPHSDINMNYLKDNPVGIDVRIGQIQTYLYNALKTTWGLNDSSFNMFGRAYRNQTSDGYIPEVFMGKDYRIRSTMTKYLLPVSLELKKP
jgi:hypothetical protein